MKGREKGGGGNWKTEGERQRGREGVNKKREDVCYESLAKLTIG